MGKKPYISTKSMRSRILLVLKCLALAAVLALVAVIWESFPIISGYGAKVLCSGVYVAGRDPEQVIRNDLSAFPLSLGTYTVNRADSSVTGTVWGLASRKAIYRYGLGATLISGATEDQVRDEPVERAAPPAINQDTVDWPMGDRMDSGRISGHGESGDGRHGGSNDGSRKAGQGGSSGGSHEADVDTAALTAAVGMAFGDGAAKKTGTRAVIVVRHGQIVAERYAPGFDRHTRLAGWSMTKSITNALVGILVGEGRLNVARAAPVAGWRDDGRNKITIDNLMRMNSGLKWWEFYAGPSDATRMLFKEKDMGKFAEKSRLADRPGTVFNYSSGTANIISAIIRQTVGDSGYYRFPYERLFYRIGMYSAILEPDAGGTFVGSSYCYATARDWARFGILYLEDGIWNGQRILPAGWVDYTRTGGDYGALWWLNRKKHHPHIPADCLACEGYEGQYVWVIPSKDMVVVRLALEHGPRLDPDRFVPAVVAAFR